MDKVKFALVLLAGMCIQSFGNDVQDLMARVKEEVELTNMLYLESDRSACKEDVQAIGSIRLNNATNWIF